MKDIDADGGSIKMKGEDVRYEGVEGGVSFLVNAVIHIQLP